MAKGPSLSRPPPKTVSPLEKDGIVYQQVMNMPQVENRTGWLRATNQSSGEVLWTRQVYQHEIDPTMERDVQEFYFRSMAFDSAGQFILIENERGERFSVNPENGEASLLR